MSDKPKQPSPTLGTCEGCGAAIGWAINPKTGKRQILNLQKTLIAILEDGPSGPQVREFKQGFVSHFATCPKRDDFRRGEPA